MENVKITKKIETETISVIKFTEDELADLGIDPNDKFTVEEKNGSILLTPFSTVEIDLEDFDKDLLIHIINRSAEKDISVHEVFEEILMEACEYWEKHDGTK